MSEIGDRVKKQIAKAIDEATFKHKEGFGDVEVELRDVDLYKAAELILALPDLAVIEPNAELPECPYRAITTREYAYKLAQQDMLKAGFKYRVVEEVK